jgi:hypothetical protein
MTPTEIVAVVGAILGGPAAVGAVKAWERVKTRELATEADEHKECREEVRVLRTDVGTLRSKVDACETKHAASSAKVDALDILVHILVREVRGRDTDRPEPAE